MLLATGLTIFMWAIHPFVGEASVVPVPQATSAASAMEAATELALPISTEFADFSTSTLVTTQILSTTTTEMADLKLMNFTDVEPDLGDDSLTLPPVAEARSAVRVMKVTKLLINAWYPWNPYGSTFAFVLTYMYQVYMIYLFKIFCRVAI